MTTGSAQTVRTGITAQCHTCGSDIYRKLSHYQRSGKHFCSPDCCSKYQSSIKLDRNCENCGKEGVRKKYCSDTCIKLAWQKRNHEKHKEAKDKWLAERPDYDKEYVEKNREKIRKYKSTWHKNNYERHPIPKGQYGSYMRNNMKKGKELENFVAEQLRLSGLDSRAHRTPGSGNGLEKGDVSNSLGLNIECKNTKKINLGQYWKQTERDASMSHTIPILVWHPPYEPLNKSVAIVGLDYFVDLLANKNQSGRREVAANLDPKLKYSVQRWVESGKSLLRELEKLA